MSVTNRVSIYIFAIVFVLTSLFVVHTVFSKISTFEMVEKSQVDIIKNIYDEFPERVYGIIDEQYHDFMDDADLVNAFYNGDRQRFAELGETYYRRLKINADNADVNIHTHDRNGFTFYRFHMPNKYGDSLINLRPMVERAYRTKEIQKGFDVGKNGLYQRVIYPVFINREFCGLFEFGIDITLLAKRINSTAGIRTGILINKENISRFKGYFYQAENETEYMVYNNAPELFDKVMQSNFKRKYHTINGSYYALIQGFNLKDYKGRPIGEFLFISDRSALMSWIFKYIISVTFLFAATIILIYLTVKHKVKPMVKEVEQHYKKAVGDLEEVNRELEERVRIELEKNRKSEELLHSKNKLADMGRMISALAHHWRQPLNALGLYVQDVSDSVKSGECDIEYIDEFEKNSMKMITQLSGTIDDFRLFFKSDHEGDNDFEIIFETINILRLVKSQLDNSNISIDLKCICGEKVFTSANIALDPDCKCKNTLIKGYRVEFRQVLLSIINNAIDAIDARRAKESVLKGAMSFRIMKSDDKIIVSVADNGCGIPSDIADNIFDPYFSTKQEGQAVGLGLYVAKVIVEQHFKGELSARNTDAGAEFTIELPLQPVLQKLHRQDTPGIS